MESPVTPGARRDSVRLLTTLRVVHPFPSFLVAGLTVALVPLANADAGLGLYLSLGIGMLLFQFAIGLVNDLVDSADDRLTKPWKPVASGAISRATAVRLAVACAGGGLLATIGLPLGAWPVGLLGLLCGLSYDVYFKRTALSWLPLSIALPLVPAWVFLAVGEWSWLLWWAYPLGALLGPSLYFANQAPDVPPERALGMQGAAHRVGASRSRLIALTLFGLAASLAVLVLLVEGREQALFAAIIAIVVALFSRRSTALLGRDGFFTLLAAGAALLAAVFVSAA
ncbi:MAG TPA: UbiA family prenyltransferase [Tepidiformaceae bacterium]